MTLEVDEQEASWVCERWCHWLYCPTNIFRMTSDWKCLLRKLVQEWRWIVNYIVMEFCHFAFCFGITSHSLTKQVFYLSLCCSEVRRCLAFHFWQNILIELQHAIKANQLRKIKSILILEMTRCLLKWYGVTKQILSSHMKLNHPPCSKVLAVCIMICNGFSSYGLANQGSCKSKSLHWTRSKFIGSHRPCLKWEKGHLCFILSQYWKYIICNPILSLIEYSFQKKPRRGSHPTLGANKRRQKWKGRVRTKVQHLRES
jgi:hypothetical protein